jgi:glucose/arabinose dehydrogenase
LGIFQEQILMKKLFVAFGIVLLLLLSIPVGLLATGTISTTSLRMMLNVMAGIPGPGADASTVANRYKLPAGFSAQLYAKDLENARFLHFTESGDLLVSRPHSGDIVLLGRDADSDGTPDSKQVLISGLSRPLGLDTHEGWLYIAESNQVGRIAFDSETGQLQGEYQVIAGDFTDNGNHWSKTLRIGPDSRLYLAQGSTCNICEEADERRATMMRFDLDGNKGEIIATGLRNSVGFDWAPWSGELYATDNGRDLLGDDFPPCELNNISEGGFYGWPYFNGSNIPDPDMGPDPLANQRQAIAPAHAFRPHNAPLGITFVDAKNLPARFQKSALVALHGSWNRSKPDGYKVVSLHWTDNGIREEDFLSGFNIDDDISGRPVDITQGSDGAFYISDDYAGAIYRITYGETAGQSDELALPQPRQKKIRLDTTPPEWLQSADLPTMASAGLQLYKKYECATCHEDGENPVSLYKLGSRLGYNAIIDTLQSPQAPMPIFPLTELQQRELAVFLLNPRLARRANSPH